MICSNCGITINPEWKMCINKNECPACGQQIMNDAMQELLVELRQALTEMPNDPEGLAGWLLTHYRLVKIGDGKPVMEFFGPNNARRNFKDASPQNGAKIGKVKEPDLLSQFEEKASLATSSKYRDIIQDITDGEIKEEVRPMTSDEAQLKDALDNPEETKAILNSMVETGAILSKGANISQNELNELRDAAGGSMDVFEQWKQTQEQDKMRRMAKINRTSGSVNRRDY